MNFNCKNYCIALQIVKINLYKFYCITIVCNNVAIAIVTMAIALHCIVQIYLISYNFCKLQLKLQFSKSEISYNSAPSELRYKRFLGGSADEGGVKMEHAYGIYGIWIENELVYIGKTKCTFYKRFQQHSSAVRCQGGTLYDGMRKAKKEGKKVEARPILSFEKNIEDFSDRDLSCMEYALIRVFQPKFNREGIIKGFRF